MDPAEILKTSHGRRSIDVFKIVAPHKANWECKSPSPSPSPPLCVLLLLLRIRADATPDVRHVEGQLPLLYGDEAIEIPGARALLDSLNAHSAPWAIVTSGTEPLVGGWLKRLGLAIPEHAVTAESVPNGKPDPACYVMGLEKLGLQGRADQVLVLEDAPAGIKAGKAAGCKVIGLATSHTVEQVLAAGPDWVVKDLDSVKVVSAADGNWTIEISNGLRQ